ncbi:MAG: MarR family transcriptional regulator [Alphaproteobacteria bacterium]|nr:MarR family transcriptional regulator [Alphaproteobacteria bacterium]
MSVSLSMREALEMWRGTLVESVRRDGPDLSARQMAVLMMVYLDPPPHTVRGLAERLRVGKPAVTRALDTLAKFDLVRRKVDELDRRSVLVQRTVPGSVWLSEFADLVAQSTPGVAETTRPQ